MKLTEEKLKNLIVQELKSIYEEVPTQDAQASQAKSPEAAKQKVASLSKLGDEFIEVGRALKSSKVKGLDTKEMGLISQLMAANLEIASSKSAGALLLRILSIIEKNK